MTRRFALFFCLFALGCTSTPADDSTSAQQSVGRESLTSTRKSTGLGAEYRNPQNWEDDSQGPVATFIYIGATGNQDKPKPYPVIYSSDPNNTYFWRENSPKVTVRRLHKDEMARFFKTLEREGFETLPWEEFGFREKIGRQRAFYVYQDGACRTVRKDRLGEAVKETFTLLENRVIALNSTY